MARKKKDPTPVLPELLDANRHHDTSKNIPTEELRDLLKGGRVMSASITIDEAQAKLRELIHQLAPGEERHHHREPGAGREVR